MASTPYLLENGTDRVLLEDGTSLLLTENYISASDSGSGADAVVTRDFVYGHDFEADTSTDGAVLSLASNNVGNPNPFDIVVAGGTGPTGRMLLKNVQNPRYGTWHTRVNFGTSTPGPVYAGWGHATAGWNEDGVVYFRGYFKLPGDFFPTATIKLIQILPDGNCGIQVNTDRTLQAYHGNGTGTSGTVAIPSYSLVQTPYVRIEAMFNPTTDIVEWWLFSPSDSTTAVDHVQTSAGAGGVDTIQGLVFGFFDGNGGVDWHMDEMAVSSSAMPGLAIPTQHFQFDLSTGTDAVQRVGLVASDSGSGSDTGIQSVAGYTFEELFNGGTAGTNITAANSNFDSVTGVDADSTITFNGTPSFEGGMCARFQTETSATLVPFLEEIFATQTTMYGRFYFRYKSSAQYGMDTTFLRGRDSANAQTWRITGKIDRKLEIRNSANTVVGTTTNAVPLDTWVRFEWKWVANAGTNGVITLRYYSDPNAALGSYDEELVSSATTMGADLARMRVGLAALEPDKRFYIDAFAMDSTNWVGPLAAQNQTADGADSGSGADAVVSVALSASDTGSGADAWTLIGLAGSDTGSGADAHVRVGLSASEAGSGSDAVATGAFATTDAGSGADAVVRVGLTASDTGSGADSAVVSVPVVASDPGSGTDIVVSVGIALSDSGSGADLVIALSAAITDSGSGSDANAGIRIPLSDTGLGTDTANAPAVVLTASDTGLGTDSVVSVALSASDTGSGSDTAVAAVPVAASDTGSGTDTWISIAIPLSDTASGSDAVVSVAVTASDTGTGTDSAVVALTKTASDTGGLASGTPANLSLNDPNVDVNDTSSASTYSTAAWTPPANTLIVAFVVSRGGTTEPASVVHGSLNFSLVIGVDIGTVGRLSLWVADAGATPGNNATTVTITGGTPGTQLHVFTMAGVDLSGGAAAAIVQSPVANANNQTSGSVTLAGAGGSNNRAIAAFSHVATEDSTERTNWTEISDGSFASPTSALITEWRSDTFETTASASWTTSTNWAGIAAEVKAGAGTAGGEQASINIQTSDSGSGDDVSSLPIQKAGSDTGTGTEVVVSIGLSTADTATGTDTAVATVPVNASDTGSGTDTVVQLEIRTSETGSGSDAPSAIAYYVTDSGSGSETSAINLPISASDTGSGADTFTSISIALTEDAQGLDDVAVTAQIDAAQSGSGNETAGFLFLVTDSGTGSEVALPLRLVRERSVYENLVGREYRTNDIAEWRSIALQGSTTLSLAADGRDDFVSIQVDTTNQNGGLVGRTLIPATAGESFYISGYLKAPELLNVGLALYDTNRELLDILTPTNVTGTGSWVEFETEVVPDDLSTAYVSFLVNNAFNGAHTFLVDNPSVVREGPQAPFVPADLGDLHAAVVGSDTGSGSDAHVTVHRAASDTGSGNDVSGTGAQAIGMVMATNGTLSDASDSTSYSLTNVHFTAGHAYVLFTVTSHGTDPAPEAVPSGGPTWTEVADFFYTGAQVRRIQAFYANASVTQDATVVISTGAVASSSINAAIVDVTGSTGTGIVQAQTASVGTNFSSITLSLAAPGSPSNRAVGVVHHRATEATDPRAGYTELVDLANTNPSSAFEVNWRSDQFDQTAGGSWATQAAGGSVYVELAAAASIGVVANMAPTDSATGADSAGPISNQTISVHDEGTGLDQSFSGTPVFASDTGSGTETVQPFSFAAYDEGMGTDAGLLLVAPQVSDTASGDDQSTGQIYITAISDTGLGTDVIEARTIEGTDNGIGNDNAPFSGDRSVTADEAGTGTDTADLAILLPPASDAATGTDTAATGAVLDSSDSALFIEAVRISQDLTDSGEGTDIALLTVPPIAVSDTGLGVDEVFSVALTSSDTATGTDQATPAVTWALEDTGEGSELAAIALTGPFDTGSGTDTFDTLVVALTLSDTGTGTDSAQAPTQPQATDSGSGDDQTTLAASIAGADTTTSDELAALAPYGTDTASGSDTTTLAALIDGSAESGTGTDTAILLAGDDRVTSDAGSGSETAAISAVLSAADDGVGSDTADNAATATGSDSGLGTESSAITAQLDAADSATSSENANFIADQFPSASDTGSGDDQASLVTATLKTGSDSGSGSDAVATLAPTVEDQGSGDEAAGAPTAAIPAAETATGTELASVVAQDARSDVGGGTDTGIVLAALTASQFATGADQASMRALLAVLDSAFGNDDAPAFAAEKLGFDFGHGTDSVSFVYGPAKVLVLEGSAGPYIVIDGKAGATIVLEGRAGRFIVLDGETTGPAQMEGSAGRFVDLAGVS